MKNMRIVMGFLALLLAATGILSSCGPDVVTTPADNALSAAWCQETANNVKDIQPSKIPDNLTHGNSGKTGGEWDANTIFSQLKHLSIEDGYVLDYVYDFNGSGGSPVLYVRPAGAAPYSTYDQFTEAANSYTPPENDITAVWFVMGQKTGVYGNKIKIDGTREGYFEYTVLQLLGEQFYLFWHANYNDIHIVSDFVEMESLLKSLGETDFGLPVNESFKQAARKINLQPTVDINGDTVTVKLVTFTKWGGFYRLAFTISGKYPYLITGLENKQLLKYDCGVMF
jgi:hypothetical protein